MKWQPGLSLQNNFQSTIGVFLTIFKYLLILSNHFLLSNAIRNLDLHGGQPTQKKASRWLTLFPGPSRLRLQELDGFEGAAGIDLDLRESDFSKPGTYFHRYL